MQLSYLITALVPLLTGCMATPIQIVGRGIMDRDINRRLLESGSLRLGERAPEGDEVFMKRSPEEDVGDAAIMKRSPEEDVGDAAIMKRSSEDDVVVIV